GTVSGLDVRIDDTAGSGGPHVEIEPGLAIDRRGEELRLPCAVTVRLRATSGVRFVTLGFQETPHPASAARSVEEGCVIGIHPDAPAPSVPLARLIHSNGRWRPDPDYERPRTRPAPHP
ncbi:MAG: hypothetical protein M3S32_11575, partial [Acidobacteriota bacterium]|nr:hypothetical protein [Acidobacteriota bacterium]